MQIGVAPCSMIIAFLFLSVRPADSKGRKTQKPKGGGNGQWLHTIPGYISATELKWLENDVNRKELQLKLDQVQTKRPENIPQCTYKDFIYDPNARACGKPCNKAHCAENMLLLQTSGSYGGCTCSSACPLDCFGRPFILVNDRCYRIATQGPCRRNEVLIPMNKTTAKCGLDACRRMTPTKASNFSTLSTYEGILEDEEVVFKFTYNNECYMTETEAFCGPGKVVRFLLPYKSPLCVPWDYEHEGCMLDFRTKAASTAIKNPCRSGYVEDTARHLCVQVKQNLWW